MAAIGQMNAVTSDLDAGRALPVQARSLKFRLIAISLAWLLASLLATGAVLVLLFRAHMQRHFDQTVQSHLEELVAASSAGSDGIAQPGLGAG